MSKTVKIIIVVAILGLGIAVYLFIKKNRQLVTLIIRIPTQPVQIQPEQTLQILHKGQQYYRYDQYQHKYFRSCRYYKFCYCRCIADQILACMNKVGTDEQKIFEILEGMTGTDIKKVIDAFGVKPYYGTD
jgi:hypothetical protein